MNSFYEAQWSSERYFWREETIFTGLALLWPSSENIFKKRQIFWELSFYVTLDMFLNFSLVSFLTCKM